MDFIQQKPLSTTPARRPPTSTSLPAQEHPSLPSDAFHSSQLSELLSMPSRGLSSTLAQLSGTTWSWLKKVYPECESSDDEAESCLYSALGELAPPAFEHSDRVGHMADRFARHLGLGQNERRNLKRAARFKEAGLLGMQLQLWSEEEAEAAAQALRLGGAFHDIGKLSISRDILNKPGPLDAEERKLIELHPLIGEALLQHIPSAHGLLPAVRNHHERWNGQGYVDGLSGDSIPWMARVIAIVDSFDAMTEHRPYRRALTEEEACEQILRDRGSHFDPQLADSFTRMVLEGLGFDEDDDNDPDETESGTEPQ
jgi:HD-GYP domain-containing protein (c-di-GMP phosphodiesterase class II)